MEEREGETLASSKQCFVKVKSLYETLGVQEVLSYFHSILTIEEEIRKEQKRSYFFLHFSIWDL